VPRPTKAFKRQKINAAIAYKKGERKEAYELWEKAAKGMHEHRAKKKNKNKAGGEAPAPPPAPAA
jgi:hypothetical protein